MNSRIRAQLENAITEQREYERAYLSEPSLSNRLAYDSISAQVDELRQQLASLENHASIELIEVRLKSSKLSDGSVPLKLVSEISNSFRRIIGHAALRRTIGGFGRRRVPEAIYDELDLRLTAILPGSSRLIVTSTSNRDLFGDGLAKDSLERLFRVLRSYGRGAEFLESITDMGPGGARQLRIFFGVIRDYHAEMDLTWRYSGETEASWKGTHEAIDSVGRALESTEMRDSQEILVSGVVELLSKRERIHLRVSDGSTIRVLFPNRLLPAVSELHLDQRVRLRCSVTETLNPHTGETATFYELIAIEK